MMRALMLVIALGACTKAGGGSEPTSQPPTTGVAPNTPPVATAGKVSVVMTAATLADDCGGTPPWGAPPPVPVTPPPAVKDRSAKQDRASEEDADTSKSKSTIARRRCEQTSMQLAVVSKGGAPTQVHIKKVELFDPSGTSLGELVASKPTRWSDKGTYEAWDETIGADQTLSVSYVLAQPNWDSVKDRWNKTYTVKAVVTVGSGDQAVQADVEVRAPTILPPNVKT